MKVKIWTYIANQCDGSACVCFFNSKEEAQKYAENDDERFCNDITYYYLDFDENGQLLNPHKIREE